MKKKRKILGIISGICGLCAICAALCCSLFLDDHNKAIKTNAQMNLDTLEDNNVKFVREDVFDEFIDSYDYLYDILPSDFDTSTIPWSYSFYYYLNGVVDNISFEKICIRIQESDFFGTSSRSLSFLVGFSDSTVNNMNSIIMYIASENDVTVFGTSSADFFFSDGEDIENSDLLYVLNNLCDYYPTIVQEYTSVYEDFLTIFTGGIVTVANGIANGVIFTAKSLFLDISIVDGVEVINGLSMFGGIVAIFVGLALAISITIRVYMWITSLGN